MFFKIAIAIVLGLMVLRTLHGMGVKAQYILLGTLWGITGVGVGACDYMAIVTGTEGWGLLGCLLTMGFLFGTGLFIYYIGSEENWWGTAPRGW